MYELIGWQRADSTLFSPIPSANWNRELPCQMLNSIGYYGFWNYYMHTGDKEAISDLYDGVRKYLHVWKINPQGTVVFRKGEWTWGDWGEGQRPSPYFQCALLYGAKGRCKHGRCNRRKEDASEYRSVMKNLKTAFNRQFWTGTRVPRPGISREDR